MAVHLSREGYEKLKKKLDWLKTVKRQEISKILEEARSKGDLRENAEYDAAKEEQAHTERQIAEIEGKLADVRILDDQDIDSTKVYVGAKVKLKDIARDGEINYTIVSKEEANFAEGKISTESPVGRALMGKKVGDKVEINVPAGTLKYEILEIKR